MRIYLCVVLAIAACHHEASGPVMEPGETVPLPPASGSVIGMLVDAATQLHLRDDQLTRLRAIDEGLTGRNDQLDASSHPVGGNDPPPQHRGGGRHRGGGMGGGMGGGGMGGGGGRGGGRHRQAGAGSGSASPNIARATDTRNANNLDALRHAFEVLDPDQRVAARKLLEDKGIDTSGVDGAPVKAPATEEPGTEDGTDEDPAPEP